jgi:hypothetical protein
MRREHFDSSNRGTATKERHVRPSRAHSPLYIDRIPRRRPFPLPHLIAFLVLALLAERDRRHLPELAGKVELCVQVQRRLGGRCGADVLRSVCGVVRAHLPELENDATIALRAEREWTIPGRQAGELGHLAEVAVDYYPGKCGIVAGCRT